MSHSENSNNIQFAMPVHTIISPDMPLPNVAPPDVPEIKEEKNREIYKCSLKELRNTVKELEKRKTNEDSNSSNEEDESDESDESNDSDEDSDASDSDTSNFTEDSEMGYNPLLEYKWNAFIQLLESHNALCVAFTKLIKK